MEFMLTYGWKAARGHEEQLLGDEWGDYGRFIVTSGSIC